MKCKGVCSDNVVIELYNNRVQEAIQSVSFQVDNFVIKENGKRKEEFSFVLVLNNLYQGYGYLKKRRETFSIDDYLKGIVAKQDNRDINRILQGYIKKKPECIIPIGSDITLERPYVKKDKIYYIRLD
jgi:DNA polymerase-3 subunit epsilon